MGSNRDWGVPGQTLILPPFAGPDDPQMRFGEPPALLAQFYLASAYTITLTGAWIAQVNANYYWYQAAGYSGTTPYTATGIVIGPALTDVYETFLGSQDANGAPINIWGANAPGPGLITPTLQIGSGLAAAAGKFILEFGSTASLSGASQYTPTASVAYDQQAERTYGGVSLPRGTVVPYQSAAATAAIGVGETAIATINAVDFWPNRAFRVTVSLYVTSSVAANFNIRIRKNNAAGTTFASAAIERATTTTNRYTFETVFKTDANGVTTNVAFCLQATAGTVTGTANADSPRLLHIEDIGAASQWPNAFTLT